MHVCVCMYICTVGVYVCLFIHTHLLCIYKRTHIHAHALTHTHAYIYTHTYNIKCQYSPNIFCCCCSCFSSSAFNSLYVPRRYAEEEVPGSLPSQVSGTLTLHRASRRGAPVCLPRMVCKETLHIVAEWSLANAAHVP